MDVDVLRARIVRHDVRQPWGFYLCGGIDYQQPLTIATVTRASPADVIGLHAGDVIVEIDNHRTEFLTLQQASDLTNFPTTTLQMTLERRVNGYERMTVERQMISSQPRETRHRYATQSREPDFCTVLSQPFGYEQQTPSSSPCTHCYQPGAAPSSSYNPSQHANNDAFSSCPQSRTFKVLQTVMHNNDSPAGVNGLPPPRSAAMDRLKSQKQQRVKVFMPQQYNSPMGMYSANNVLDTFTAQAESMLDSFSSSDGANTGQEYRPLNNSTSHH